MFKVSFPGFCRALASVLIFLLNFSVLMHSSFEGNVEIFPSLLSPSQPCPKKARQDDGTEEYSHYIQTAESALKALQALTEDNSNMAPQWLNARLQELQNLITNINTATCKQ